MAKTMKQASKKIDSVLAEHDRKVAASRIEQHCRRFWNDLYTMIESLPQGDDGARIVRKMFDAWKNEAIQDGEERDSWKGGLLLQADAFEGLTYILNRWQ